MILSFKPSFVNLIKRKIKIHTIREDKHGRWKVGMKIHFWRGNPRNVNKNPHQFGEGYVSDIRKITIVPPEYTFPAFAALAGCKIYIDNVELSDSEKQTLMMHDGFAFPQRFFEFFPKKFRGKLISWMDFKEINNGKK